jgi:hypothetical protein
MLLDNGEIKEFDSPKSLLLDKNSSFYKMIMENGNDYYQKLFDMIEN